MELKKKSQDIKGTNVGIEQLEKEKRMFENLQHELKKTSN